LLGLVAFALLLTIVFTLIYAAFSPASIGFILRVNEEDEKINAVGPE
jgi:hypothetical protein